jgi:hypothetical protein
MPGLRIPSAVSALLLGSTYVAAFVYFGAFFSFPVAGSPAEKMRFLAEHQLQVSLVYFSIYVLFGVLLAVVVVGLHEVLRGVSPPLAALASLFGVVWVGLVIASGMIYTVGLDHALNLLDESPEAAYSLWTTLSVIGDSLGGGNELVGGLWVLLVSLVALKGRVLLRALNYLGCFVGSVGIATIYPAELLTALFGLSQIIWFLWLALALARPQAGAG